MKRRLQFVVTGLLLAALLCSCGNRQDSPGGTSRPDTSTEAGPVEKPDHTPLSPSDQTVYPAEPERVTLPHGQKPESDQLLLQQEKVPADEEGGEPEDVYHDVSKLPNVIAVPSGYVDQGSQVSVPLRVCGIVNLCGLDIQLRYDPTLVRLSGIQNQNSNVMFNNKAEEGVLLLNFISLENMTGSFDLGELQFEALVPDTCLSPINIEVVDLAVMNESNEPVPVKYTATGGTLWLNEPGRED